MGPKEIIEELKTNFQCILHNSKILGLLLYGSVSTGMNHEHSDIDLCFVVPEYTPLVDIYHYIIENATNLRDEYDIRFFEEFSLPMKIQVIEHGIPIYPEDVGALYEYFFKYQKLWQDNLFRVQYII